MLCSSRTPSGHPLLGVQVIASLRLARGVNSILKNEIVLLLVTRGAAERIVPHFDRVLHDVFPLLANAGGPVAVMDARFAVTYSRPNIFVGLVDAGGGSELGCGGGLDLKDFLDGVDVGAPDFSKSGAGI